MVEERTGGKKNPEPKIVGTILSVDYSIEKKIPPNLVVDATGQVPTSGYSKVQLMRVVYATPPEDGIQDYVLLAVPPSDQAAAVVSEVKAVDRWTGYEREAPWIKGMRVHGVDDGVIVKMTSAR